MSRIVSVERHTGQPVYPADYTGGEEYVLKIEPTERGRFMVDALINALARRSVNEEGEPNIDERFAYVMMDLAFNVGKANQVVLPGPGAVALRGALEEYVQLFGEDRGDGLMPQDFEAVAEQLPAPQ